MADQRWEWRPTPRAGQYLRLHDDRGEVEALFYASKGSIDAPTRARLLAILNAHEALLAIAERWGAVLGMKEAMGVLRTDEEPWLARIRAAVEPFPAPDDGAA